jgi:hypothetical protein
VTRVPGFAADGFIVIRGLTINCTFTGSVR